jgi:hypothetical protein
VRVGVAIFGLALAALLSVPAVAVRGQAAAPANDGVTLDHLLHLTEPVSIAGQPMAIVHIYSEFPNYAWVDDADEGISAVDDVARAALVYLWQYERSGDAELLEWARRCLEFVRYMQAEDGEFYNFVFTREGEINRTGGTSYKSLGWWAMRALWALGEGVRVFAPVDAAYADALEAAYLRTESAVAATMSNYGQYAQLHGFEIPAWIPNAEPAVAAIGLLGMSGYYQARPNAGTAEIITRIADGIAEYRLGSDSEYPFGMHPTRSNAPGFWHNWGAHMPHALVMAGMALGRQDWIDSAAATAESFLLRHLAFEPFRHIGVVPYRLEQIAYGTNMLVQAYAALYRATGEERYAQLAALAGSWFFGNNMAGVQMYSPETGRTFDGINGPVTWRVNRNAGAESTIEGLMSMIALAQLPESAQPFLTAQTVSETRPIVLQAEDGQRVVGTPAYFSGNWTGEGYISAGRYVGLSEGQRMRLRFSLDAAEAGDYLVYAAHVRQAVESDASLIPRIAAAPVIDGSAEDWGDAGLTLVADRAGQFLRGGGLWRGPEVDSHRVRLAWDDEHLYVYAAIRDPEHTQEFTVSGVWQGDALWLYFTEGTAARSLSVKLTLAQTPQGPQIWDWQRARFARGAALVWQPAEDGLGYHYEAALPWEALGMDAPQPGASLGFEAGRGIGGNSFMDLTGRDPDVASNLLQLTLTSPDAPVQSGQAPRVALEVRVDREPDFVLQQTVSPDSDYFWLDRVTLQPVRLEAGEHFIRYAYAGETATAGANPGLSRIDAFVLYPAIGQRVIALTDGRRYALRYDTLTGESTLRLITE